MQADEVIEDWELWGDPREVERRKADRRRAAQPLHVRQAQVCLSPYLMPNDHLPPLATTRQYVVTSGTRISCLLLSVSWWDHDVLDHQPVIGESWGHALHT